MTIHQDSIFFLPLQPAPREVYEPLYPDTAFVYPEYTETIPGPVGVITAFEVRPARLDNGNRRNSSDYDWITIVLVAGFLIFAFARFNYSRRMGQLMKACFVPRAVSSLYREGNPFNEQVTLVLGAIYLLTSSLFLYIIFERFDWLPNDLVRNEWLYTGIFIANASYWLLKALANRMLAHIFKTYEATGSYLLNNLLFNLTLGIFLLMILPLVVYTGSDIIFNIALFATALLVVYKVFRGILVGLSISHFPLFYLFLYICTLEVAPLLVLAKFFMAHTGM